MRFMSAPAPSLRLRPPPLPLLPRALGFRTCGRCEESTRPLCTSRSGPPSNPKETPSGAWKSCPTSLPRSASMSLTGSCGRWGQRCNSRLVRAPSRRHLFFVLYFLYFIFWLLVVVRRLVALTPSLPVRSRQASSLS